MSGHGRREAAARADAAAWRNRVIDDAQSTEGRAAARAREISIDLVIAVAELIAAYMSSGETEISRTAMPARRLRTGRRKTRSSPSCKR
jgi:hypothetical protein